MTVPPPIASVAGSSAAAEELSCISIVVPVYNSAEILPILVEELGRWLASAGIRGELILVNDGSGDRSWAVIRDLASRHEWVRGLEMMRNYGQHNALLCGIRQARYPVIVTIDDDLQHPPAAISLLLAGLRAGADVVYGTPITEQHGLLRDLASQITKIALKSAMGVDVARNVSAFRAFRTQIREAFTSYTGPFVSIDVLLTWGTTRFDSVKVEHAPRRAGVSQYTVRKLITHAVNMMTGFSIRPLQLASMTGFAFTVFGLLVLAYVLLRYVLQGNPVPGFPFLASIIAIFSGAQLFALGIIGEYLARVHFRVMDKPPYVVRSTT